MTSKAGCWMEPLLTNSMQRLSRTLQIWALIVGGSSVVFALIVSTVLIFQHLLAYNKPAEQKWIICILLMVPIYASESIVSLVEHKLSIPCDILRNCYEAFALYSFGNYLIACLGGENETKEFLNKPVHDLSKGLLNEKKNGCVNHPFPLNMIIKPWVLGEEFYRISKFGIVQYMILKTVCALLALILELCGAYGDGHFKWNYGYPYITIVLNFSQTWALYCLVQFYSVTHEELWQIRPLAKFISFKAIVFATWWQGVAIAIICSLGSLKSSLPQGFQTSLQDFLICIEMSIAAVAHMFVFPAKPYQFMDDDSSDSLKFHTKVIKIIPDKDSNIQEPEAQFLEEEAQTAHTSIKESVQDIVIGGGEHVIHDVLVTVSQAVEPVEKGVTKINENLRHLSWGERVEDKGREIEIDEEISETILDNKSEVINLERCNTMKDDV